MGRVVEMPLPRLGETMEEGRIGLIIKKPGEKFRRGETLLEVESDKTTVEVPALQDGVLVEWLVTSDQMVPVESAIARIEIEGIAAAEVKVREAVQAPAVTLKVAKHSVNLNAGTRPRTSTAARAAARRLGIDLAMISGTGRNGRISRADLESVSRPARATYHVETPHGKIFIREWPAQGIARGVAVLIHGLFADSQSFVIQGRKLAAKGFRTLAVDLPGHGKTESSAETVPDIVAALSAAIPSIPLHIIGHSFGAVIATNLADRARSLTLLAPGGTGEEINGGFLAAMLGGHVDKALASLGESVPPEAVADLADQLARNSTQLKAIVSGIADGNRQSGSILSALARLTIPVTAIYMRDDAIIPAHHALNLSSNVAVRFLRSASHLPHWRDPDLIAKLVADQGR